MVQLDLSVLSHADGLQGLQQQGEFSRSAGAVTYTIVCIKELPAGAYVMRNTWGLMHQKDCQQDL